MENKKIYYNIGYVNAETGKMTVDLKTTDFYVAAKFWCENSTRMQCIITFE